MANPNSITFLHRSECTKNQVFRRRLNNWLYGDAEMPVEIRTAVDDLSPNALAALSRFGSALGKLNHAIAEGLSLDAVSRSFDGLSLDAASHPHARQFAMG